MGYRSLEYCESVALLGFGFRDWSEFEKKHQKRTVIYRAKRKMQIQYVAYKLNEAYNSGMFDGLLTRTK